MTASLPLHVQSVHPHTSPASMPLKLYHNANMPPHDASTKSYPSSRSAAGYIDLGPLSCCLESPERPKLGLFTRRNPDLHVNVERCSSRGLPSPTSPQLIADDVPSDDGSAPPSTPPEELPERETTWELIPYDVPWGEEFMDYHPGILPGPEGICLFLRSPTPIEKRRAVQACQLCRERKAKVGRLGYVVVEYTR